VNIFTGGLALLNLLGVFGNIWLLRRSTRAGPHADPTAGQIDRLCKELEAQQVNVTLTAQVALSESELSYQVRVVLESATETLARYLAVLGGLRNV